MIPMPPHPLPPEQRGEPQPLRHLVFGNELVRALRLVDDELAHLQLRVGDGRPGHARVPRPPEPLVQDVLAPAVPVGGVDVAHAALLAHVRVVVALVRLGDEVREEDGRARRGLHALGKVQRLQPPVLGILLLAGVEDEDVDQTAVRVDGGFDGGREFADGRGEEVVRGVYDGEFGEEGGAPGVLVGAGAVVDVHAEVFGEELRCVAVAHDDALEVAFEEPDDIDLEFLDDVAHAALGAPHVVIKAEVDCPDTGCYALRLGVIGRVVIAGEAKIGDRHGKELQGQKHVEVVGALLASGRVGRWDFSFRSWGKRLC